MRTPRKTPTKEQREWMKENGYTEQQMDEFWDENIGTNPVVRNLNQHGMSWRDMNLCVVKNLPTQKERDLKILKEKELKEQAEKDAALKIKQDREYYNEYFDEVIIAKIENKEDLTDKELRTLVTEYDVETTYGENRRWNRSVTTIIQIKDRFFSIDWQEGLTELQEDYFDSQPVEVIRHTYEKVITVVEWIAKFR